MTANYAWVITQDNISSPPQTAVGIIGPSNVDPALGKKEIRNHPKAQKFRLVDDDKEIYAYGFFVDLYAGTDPYAGPDGFEPLDDFGMPNWGATSIEYRNSEGEYVGL
jgi:hypothetical protein